MIRPEVLLLAGPPCAGKSTVGRVLAEEPRYEQWTYLEVDALFQLVLPRSDRSRGDRMLAYDGTHALARTLLEHRRPCILECTYARQDQRGSLARVMARLPASSLRVVEFDVTPEEALARFRHRRDATDLDEGSLRERVENYPHWDGAFQVSSDSVAASEMARQITEWLAGSPADIDLDAWVRAGRQ